MANKVTCELFIAINEEGDWSVATDESDALSTLQDEQGGYQCRVVKVSVKIEPPVMAETEIDVPAEAVHIAEGKVA